MKLDDCANVRTGLVLARKQANDIIDDNLYKYRQLNLKCIREDGFILHDLIDDYIANEKLKLEYLTHKNDVIIRLSYPYTAVLIDETSEGIVIPSHFVIVRTNTNRLLPEYLYWLFNTEKIKKSILLNNTGGILGTIKPSFFAELNIKMISIEKQKLISDIYQTAHKETELLFELAKQKQILYNEMTSKIYNNGKR